MSCYTVGAVVYSIGRTATSDAAWVQFGSSFADASTNLDVLHHDRLLPAPPHRLYGERASDIPPAARHGPDQPLNVTL